MTHAGERMMEKKLNRWTWLFSGVVFILMLMMRRYRIDTDIDFSFLPALYSGLNILTFFALVAAFYFIRVRKNMAVHRKLMTMAVFLSAAFLVLYVLYHFTTPEKPYCGEGSIRTWYFLILISHIVLAAVILPFILMTYIRAYTMQYRRHQLLARWVWPVWTYVALTGPIIYLMLRPCH